MQVLWWPNSPRAFPSSISLFLSHHVPLTPANYNLVRLTLRASSLPPHTPLAPPHLLSMSLIMLTLWDIHSPPFPNPSIHFYHGCMPFMVLLVCPDLNYRRSSPYRSKSLPYQGCGSTSAPFFFAPTISHATTLFFPSTLSPPFFYVFSVLLPSALVGPWGICTVVEGMKESVRRVVLQRKFPGWVILTPRKKGWRRGKKEGEGCNSGEK